MVLLDFVPTPKREAPLPLRVAQALAEAGVCLTPREGEGVEDRDRRLETGLMALFRDQRDDAAYEALYGRSRGVLLSWIVHLLARSGLGADPVELLQDTYINIYRYASSFKDVGTNSFRGWARTIAANLVRRSARRRGLSLEVLADGGRQIADSRSGPEETALVSEEEDELKRAWVLLLLHYAQAYQLLSPRDRRALHLIEVEGLSYSEAGKHLGVGRSNMKMIMFRGRKRLRAHILGAMCQGNTGSSARAVS